jgi:hypothetical protein
VKEFSKAYWGTESERVFIGETVKVKVENSSKKEGRWKSVVC